MLLVGVLLLLLAPFWPEAAALDQATTDCAMRQLLLDFAQSRQPNLQTQQLKAVADSLELASLCNVSDTRLGRSSAINYPPPSPSNALVVDYTHGSDISGTGNLSHPLKTVAHALEMVPRRHPNDRRIVLRHGIHFLSQTLQLTPAHSHLHLGPYCSGSAACEVAWLSGGIPLSNVSWAPADSSQNIWKAVIRGPAALAGLKPAASLHWLNDVGDATVLTLARYPNRRPEDGTLDRGSLLDVLTGTDAVWEHRPVTKRAVTKVEVAANVSVPRSVSHFANHWAIGVGGPCDRFDPPGGFLCTNGTGGGYDWDDRGPFFPSALALNNASKLFPNLAKWPRNLSQATLTTWTNGWYTSTIPLTSLDQTNRLVIDEAKWSPQGGRAWHFDLSKVPYQLCSGDVRSMCGPLKVEGLLAELDAPSEFFFEEAPGETASAVLHLFYNSSSRVPPPTSMTLVVPSLRELVHVHGLYAEDSRKNPPTTAVTNVTITQLGFRDTATSVLAKHGVPSGGDWSLQRTAAVFLEGTMGVTISNATFKYLGGIGFMVSGYNRGTTVEDSEFSYIGGSAAAGWGYTRPSVDDPVIPAGMGVDGTNGNQPYGTVLRRVVCHDIGTVEKQSSCWFQAKTGSTTVEDSLFYNCPRALINFNDGFHGGNLVRGNALWNSCRESGDHGAINSWDRMVFTSMVHGESSVFPLYNNVSHNFFISNYNSFNGIDNDDGSSYYDISNNVFYMGEGLKSDYRGHSKLYHDNLNIGAGVCCFQFGFPTCPDDFWKAPCGRDAEVPSNEYYQEGHTDHCYSNRCIQAPGGSWKSGAFSILWGCNASLPGCHGQGPLAIMDVFNNSVYKESGRKCEAGPQNKSCDLWCGGTLLSVKEFEEQCGAQGGNEVIEGIPDLSQILIWAKQKLAL